MADVMRMDSTAGAAARNGAAWTENGAAARTGAVWTENGAPERAGRNQRTMSNEEAWQDIRRRYRREQARVRERERQQLVRLIRRLSLLVIVAVASLWAFAAFPRVSRVLTVEAGSPRPTAADFVQGGFFQAEAVSGLDDSVDMHRPGDYHVTLRVMRLDRTVTLRVVDTIPPEVEVRDVKSYNFETVTPQDFLVSVSDETETDVGFAASPDMDLPGSQEVQIAVTDAAGNRTVKTANLEVIQDDVPPVIEGVKEMTVTLGESVSYKKGVTVTDNVDDAVELSVDNSQVNLKKAGNYTVIYSAEDFAGNRTEVSTVLHVVNPSAANVTQEALDIVADQLLSEILTDGMDDYQKAKAIYQFCRYRIGYVDTSEKDEWTRAAWQGLTKRSGDCYVYCMTSRELLTRAGITNMVIERIPRGNSMHYWNLIDIGEGWHHFDTTPRAGTTRSFFYLTDSELMSYSDNHRGTHNYDRSKYPAVVP